MRPGRAVGSLGLANKAGGFTENDARMASAFSELAALALHHSRTLQLLEDSETRFRLIAHSARNAIVTADASGTIASWNPAAERLFGYRSEEMLGQPVSRLVPERLRAAQQAGFGRALSQGTLKGPNQAHELTGCRSDGSEVAVELSVSLWRSGSKAFSTAIIRDITERKQAEEALRKRSEELAAFNEAMVGREARLIELKEEINRLCAELGREPAYPPVWRKGP